MNVESSKPPSGRPRRRWRSLAVALALVAAGLLAPFAWRRGRDGNDQAVRSRLAVEVAPPIVSDAFPNTRPDVSYVGDRACADCHAEIAASFAQHSMGRSLAAVDVGSATAPPDATFEADGLEYAIEHRDGAVVHSETRRGADGAVVARIEAEVRYALGSGSHGISYLIERGDGYLDQSPISWYAQEGRWDLAPGYRASNPHFERPITPACLFCHAGRVEPVPGTSNRFEPPIFRDHAVSCERCHGPGELHVERLGGLDQDGRATIVNPALLEPRLREAVCEQCHLQGEVRVERLGRKATDYRPGLPLEAFLATFVRADAGASGAGQKAVGHVEQIRSSGCFKGSGGRLGCTSCHDPHRLPEPAIRVEHYRDRCLECHLQRAACALPEPDRLAESPEDDCTACHMPRAPVLDIVHATRSLHTIPRRAEDQPEPVDAFVPDPSSLVPMTVRDGEEVSGPNDRDRGVALALFGREKAGPLEAPGFARAVLSALESSLESHPGDLAAWEARAEALDILGEPVEALESAERAIALMPTERMLDLATLLAAGLGRADRAIAANDRLLEVNPTRSSYHFNRAQLLAHRGRWADVVDACRATLRLNPEDLDARRLLVQALVARGRRAEANAEFERLQGFDPTLR